MGNLVYAAIMSVDGYIADERGDFEWAAPDEEVHAFVNDLERRSGTQLYGRRMYETLKVWEHPEEFAGDSEVMHDFARSWQAADKIVYSTTLTTVDTARTRIERTFEPDAVRALKAGTATDLTIGGPHLAAHAIAAGLVDDYHFFVVPHVVGGGNAALPPGARLALHLVAERRFRGGTVHLHYRPGAEGP
jgi:dihydrofolate reductase